MTTVQGGILFQDDGAMTVNTVAPTETNRHRFNTDDLGEVFIEVATSPAATDPRMGGLAYTAAGALYCTTSAVGATSVSDGGIARTATGQMHITFTAPSPSFYNGGYMVSGTGQVYVAVSPEFFAPFADAGSGVVTTTLTAGTGSATFVRATVATTRLATGLLGSVASGSPRSYYLADLTYAGYLAEGAATNLQIGSQTMDGAGWSAVRASWSANALAAPDGTTTAEKLVEDATATNTHVGLSGANITVVDTSVYTTTVFAKAGERTWFQLQEGTGVTAGAYFNLGAGAVGTVSGTGSPSASIEAWANGWYRCRLTWTASGTAARIRLFLATGDGGAIYSGDGASGAYFWGAQMELGAFPTSYIVTVAAAATRNADVLTYTFAGNALAATGTAYADLSTLWATSGAASVAIGFGTTAIGPLYEAAAVAATSIATSDGTTVVTKAALTSMATAIRKRTSSWGTALNVTGDGAAVATAAFDGDMGSTGIGIGTEGDGSASTFFGTIKNVRIWTSQLPDAVLQAITT